MKFKPTDHFKVSPEVLAQEVNGETVLLNLDGENYFGLNEVGTRVWQLLQKPHDMSTLVESLHTDYDVSRTQLESDISVLLAELLKDGLVSLTKKD